MHIFIWTYKCLFAIAVAVKDDIIINEQKQQQADGKEKKNCYLSKDSKFRRNDKNNNNAVTTTTRPTTTTIIITTIKTNKQATLGLTKEYLHSLQLADKIVPMCSMPALCKRSNYNK